MTFHPDFWVAVATASPVIALAAVVSTRDVLALSTAATDLRGAARSAKRGLAFVSQAVPVLLGANIALQILALYAALISLADESDGHKSLHSYALGEVIGFLLVLANVILLYYGNRLVKRGEDGALAAAQADPETPDQTG